LKNYQLSLDRVELCFDGGAIFKFQMLDYLFITDCKNQKTLEAFKVLILVEKGQIGPDITFLGYCGSVRAGIWFSFKDPCLLPLDYIRGEDGQYYLDKLLSYFPGSFEWLTDKEVEEIYWE